MRFLRFLLVPWTAVVVYTFFSFFVGQNGLYVRKYLEAERIRLSEHQKSLEAAQKDFLKTKDNLLNDRDTVAVYARQLGYGSGDEKIIRIKGLGVTVNTVIPEDQVFYSIDPEFVSDKKIKLISAFFALLVLAFFLINSYST